MMDFCIIFQAREIFTVLNLSPTKTYTWDQILNVHTFSLLRAWLENIYAEHQTFPGSLHKAVRLEPLTDTFKTGVVDYCLRLLDQSSTKLSSEKIASAGSPSSKWCQKS